MPTIDDLGGLWRRSLIAFRAGPRDERTWVRWLQGPRGFVDLRQPANKPSFEGIDYLRQLEMPQVEWLAQQHGFAGAFVECDRYFEWERHIDFQPTTEQRDRGALRWENSILVEEALDQSYREHWHRETAAAEPGNALRLVNRADGRSAIIVRVGAVFMFGRGRNARLQTHPNLVDYVKSAASRAAAQDLLDCEISFGRVTGTHWRIERSTLPFKEGRRFRTSINRARTVVTLDDVAPDGRHFAIPWEISELQGADSDQWLTSALPQD